MTTTKARPFFKQVGGKTRLLPKLLARVPQSFGTYHEPFLGGGALYWALAAERVFYAHLTDASRPISSAWIALRDDVDGLIRKLRRMPTGDVAFFHKQRERDHHSMDVGARAAWFLYLNKTCYNGLWRVNRSGRFNAPYGRYDKPPTFDFDLLRACARTLAKRPKAKVACADFSYVLQRAAKGDFVYFDPPYLPISDTADFTAYTEMPFRLEEHVKLRDIALRLKLRKVHVMISNCAHPEIVKLYQERFEIEEVAAPRSINSDTSKRGAVPELIIR